MGIGCEFVPFLDYLGQYVAVLDMHVLAAASKRTPSGCDVFSISALASKSSCATSVSTSLPSSKERDLLSSGDGAISSQICSGQLSGSIWRSSTLSQVYLHSLVYTVE